MSRGRHCEWVDLGAPYGMVFVQLTKPRSAFNAEEWAQLVDGLRKFNAELDAQQSVETGQ